jgi:hypothetical protein
LNRKNIVSDLKLSARRCGELYPVLLDKEGNVLDGNHRLKADPNWPKIILENVETEQDRLIVKLVGNVCRRSISSAEKTQLVGELASIFLSQGFKRGQVAYKVAEKTGMSYRWVMTYLPNRLKQYPGRGGPSTKQAFDTISENTAYSRVAEPATIFSSICANSGEDILTITNYTNTQFVSMLLDKKIYSRIHNASLNLGIKPSLIIGNALLLALRCLENLGYATPLEEVQ